MYSPSVVRLASKGTEEQGRRKAVRTAPWQEAEEETGKLKKGQAEQYMDGRDLKGTEDVGVR